MNLLTNIAITLVATAIGFVGLYNYAPQDSISIGDDTFGATVTTIQGSDTLKNSRGVINTNFSNINTDLEALQATTTMSLLTGVGTITTGTWNATAVGEVYGGTAQTSYTTGDILYASGSNTLSKLGIGSSNQVLTVTGGVPAWSTQSVDETADYNFTGTSFGVKNLVASSTVANPFILNGLSLNTPSSLPTATTTMAVSPTGYITFTSPIATSTVFTTSGTWVKPAGVDKVKVRLVGGGGGGGGTDSGDANDAGGGGGAGGYAEAIVSVSGNVTVTVGALGAGVSSEAGANGGDSIFAGDVTVTASGGTGGPQASASAVASGGAGGGTTNADVGVTGETGHRCYNAITTFGCGGGSSPLGNGGIDTIASSAGAGASASGYGSGGAGATASNSDTAGGSGTAGIVIVEWYQ